MLLHGFVRTPCPADSEDSCGRPPIALALCLSASWERMDPQPPNQAAPSQPSLPRSAGFDPLTAALLVGIERDLGAVPIVRDANDALGRSGGELEGVKWEREKDGDENGAEHSAKMAHPEGSATFHLGGGYLT